MTKNLSQKISLFSFSLSLMIVFYHTAGIVRDNMVRPINNIDYRIYFAGRSIFASMLGAVPLGIYFFISAFLLYINADEQNVKAKSVKRIKTLGIPFVIWNLFEAVFLTIGQQKFPCETIGLLMLRLSFDPFDGPLWYVFALLIFSLLAPFIIKLKRNLPKLNIYGAVFLTICCFAFSIAYHHEFITHKLYWLERIIQYLPYYMAGILVAWYGKSIYSEKYSKAIQKFAILINVLAMLLVIITGGG